MLLSIRHLTELAYSQRISETVMEIRMTPRTDAHQTMRGSRIEVGPSAPLMELDDWLGNRVHHFSIVPFHDRVMILAESAVEVRRGYPEVAAAPDTAPIPIPVAEHRLFDFLGHHGPIVPDPRLADLARALDLDGTTRTGEIAARIAAGLRDHVQYRKGATTSSTRLDQVLDAGAGVCQDLAHVAIALLRRQGIPARYVSGYYHSAQGGELETHAWCEAYLPSAGWVPIDPTHRGVVGVGHVVVAVGRDFSDVPPNRGVFRGDAEESIDVTVTIEEIESPPEGLLAPRAASLSVPSYLEGPRVHREQLDYQQEQQQQQ